MLRVYISPLRLCTGDLLTAIAPERDQPVLFPRWVAYTANSSPLLQCLLERLVRQRLSRTLSTLLLLRLVLTCDLKYAV